MFCENILNRVSQLESKEVSHYSLLKQPMAFYSRRLTLLVLLERQRSYFTNFPINSKKLHVTSARLETF